ncbi:F-box/kelch-repeat protein At3g23880-like [Vicia villosa]|uniref:F-box/kelch-repeat protein At3g23880-like n=1 Tax=Vicia villosa TaxID=3911 RepID=UPI00273AB819|nr:F-box/kelch-repeat protein At3g23880-like [Vicia villosa]
MNPSTAKLWKSNGNLIFLPEELIVQVLSYLPVKSLTQLRCVNKAWNTIISDPKFIKLHLQRSTKDRRNLTQILCFFKDSCMQPYPLNALLNTPSMDVPTIDYTEIFFSHGSNPLVSNLLYQFIGSCNGLLCFQVFSPTDFQNTLFQLWNPATKAFSIYFGPHSNSHTHIYDYLRFSKFSFGYDNSTNTYKILYMSPNKFEIFSYGGNVWKLIQLFHVVPLDHWNIAPKKRRFYNQDMYLNDTINFLARDIAQHIVIISLNLGTETYHELLPPRDFVEVRLHLPTISVLEDSLCFCHHTQKTDFIIWKMKELGIEKAWTQFLKISYHDLDIRIKYRYFLTPLCVYESGIALILSNRRRGLEVIIYNLSDNRIEKTRLSNLKWIFPYNYVESLVSPY